MLISASQPRAPECLTYADGVDEWDEKQVAQAPDSTANCSKRLKLWTTALIRLRKPRVAASGALDEIDDKGYTPDGQTHAQLLQQRQS